MARKETYIAIDLGASSGRGVLGELSDDILSIRELCRFPNGMSSVLGHLHWNIYSLSTSFNVN